jgi:fumarate reductase subunit C
MVTKKDAKPITIQRTAAYIDVGEMISGILLIIFAFCHLALVFTVALGTGGEVFDKIALWLEETYLAQLTLKHFDTMLWFVQAGSGLLIFAFAFAHLWHIFTGLPIEATKSAEAARGGMLWFYVPFLLVLATHFSAGFYRICIKWNWIPRKFAIPLSWIMFVFYVAVAIFNISVFLRIPIEGGV